MRKPITVAAVLVLAGAALFALLFAAQATARAEPAAPQTTYTINNCTEAGFNNALNAANDGDVIHVRCASSSPGTRDVIIFSAQKVITKSITILGMHPVTGVNRLSGGDATNLFQVNAGKTLTLTNITVEHGYNTGSSNGYSL